MCAQCENHRALEAEAMSRASAAAGHKRAYELDAASFHRKHLERYEQAHAIDRR